MSTASSLSQLVTRFVSSATEPVALAEIQAGVETFGPIKRADPKGALRSAIYQDPLIESLGGRPARYVWLPSHLKGSSFRQPLAHSDLVAGTLVLGREAWTALWPEFYGSAAVRRGDVVLELEGGPELRTRVEHLVRMQAVWGLRPTPALADWYERVAAKPEDELVIHAVDVDERRYTVTLCRRANRDERAMAARNKVLADAAELVMRAGRPPIPDYHLVPRLIAFDAYADPLPPDSLEPVLRADLRFVVGPYDMWLTEKLVDSLERDQEILPEPYDAPRPCGSRHAAHTECARRAWGEYLFDLGMEYVWAGFAVAAEAYYREALRMDAGHADAWVHLGNLRFEEGHIEEALGHYDRAQAAAEVRTIGDPARYHEPFWLEIDSRPFMRALHGRGLCLWRLGQNDEAREVFTWMLRLNPGDNQGVRFLLRDLDKSLTWEESVR